MNQRVLGILAASVAITTALWVTLLIIQEASAPAVDNLQQKIESLDNLNFLFYLTYVNATLITIFTIALFAGFYEYCHPENPLWAIIGLVFIPIYGIGNLVSYLSQIFVLPRLLDIYRIPELKKSASLIIGELIQNWSGTSIEALNGLSYAILGISSIIFGTLMFRMQPKVKLASSLLSLSGILSIIAFIGMACRNPVLSMMFMLSGFIYLVSVILYGSFFLRTQ